MNTLVFMLIRGMLLFSILMVLSCTSTRKIDGCNETVTIEDMRLLDGCQFLLSTQEGQKLLPVNEAEFSLADFKTARISYKEQKDFASICMAEDLSVKLTCFVGIDSSYLPRKPECLETTQMPASGWLQDVVQDWQAVRITRYRYLDGFAYLCSKAGDVRFYDCQGNLICSETENPEMCARKRAALTDELVIYTAHR